MNDLLTAAELAPIFKRSAYTILQWKREGKITAEIDTGHTILFDAAKVRKQLAKQSRKPAKPMRRNGEVMVPTY